MMRAMPFRSSPRAVFSRVVLPVVVSPPRLMRLSRSFGALALTPVGGRPPLTGSGEGGGAR